SVLPTTPRMSYALKMDWEIIDSLSVRAWKMILAASRRRRASRGKPCGTGIGDRWSDPDPTYNRGF
ncbi:hypothetical protein, partial [Burkholderia pseudomultivorans]|uniref:hypothetical protein n=2 Tax=Burkholderia pseudomultivorans TaxID=1207504 RepID=UPI001E4BE832